MNAYEATAEELRAALLTEPAKVLQVCCSPIKEDPSNPGKMLPTRPDVVLTTDEIVAAARLAPRVGIAAAKHLLPADVLAELAKLEPSTALYFASDLLDPKLVKQLREAVAKESQE